MRFICMQLLCFCSVVLSVQGAEIVPGIEDPGIEIRQTLKEKHLFNYFALGTTAPKEWFLEAREQNGTKFHFRQAYFSGGAAWDGIKGSWDSVFLHNWNKWVNPDKRKGVWAEKFITDSIEAKCIPWITMYNLAQSHPADYKPGPAKATPVNAKNTKTMKAYWEQVKLIMQLADKYKPHPIVIHVEPDEWGHLLLHATGSPMDSFTVDVKVGSTGVPELEGLPDDMKGYSHAWLKMRALYAPTNVILIANPSAWDQKGKMSAANWVRVAKECDMTAWDAAVLETGDRDIGCTPGKGLAPPYKVVDTTGSHFDDINEQHRWIAQFTKETRLPVYFWQVGLGNFYYTSCNQTHGHFADRIAQGLLEGYPKNPAIANYVKIGCYGFVFSPGQAHQTHCYDFKKDGITNPPAITGNLGHIAKYADDDGGYMRERAAMYYKDPYPILADKPKSSKKEKKKKEKRVRKKRVKKVTPKPDAAAWDDWVAYLKERASVAVTKKKKPVFVFSMLKKEVELRSVGATCDLYVFSMKSEMKFDIFKRLKPADGASLALAVLNKTNPKDQAMAGFFLIADGKDSEARGYLAKSTAALKTAVEAAFPKAEAAPEAE